MHLKAQSTLIMSRTYTVKYIVSIFVFKLRNSDINSVTIFLEYLVFKNCLPTSESVDVNIFICTIYVFSSSIHKRMNTEMRPKKGIYFYFIMFRSPRMHSSLNIKENYSNQTHKRLLFSFLPSYMNIPGPIKFLV